MAVPATIIADVLRELNSFSIKNRKPDPFTEKRIRANIDKLRGVNPRGAMLCEAILATLHKNYNEVVSLYRRILRDNPKAADMHENFANSLHRLGHINEAMTQYMEAMELERTSSSLLMDIASCCHTIMRPDLLVKAVDIYVSATGNSDIVEDGQVSSGIGLFNTMNDMGIDFIDANNLYSCVEKVTQRFNLNIESSGFQRSDLYGGPGLCHYVGISASSDLIVEMNDVLCEEIVDRNAMAIISQVSVAFVPFEGLAAEEPSETLDHYN